MSYTFLFKATTDNELYREDDTVELGSIAAAASIEKEFVFSSPDVDTKLVNVGIHFENATDYDSMRMLKLLGAEYPNTYGLYIKQTYVINGMITKNADGSSPDLSVVNEAPTSIDRTGSTFRFYLKNIPTDTTGSGIPIQIIDSANGITWTETGTGTGAFGAPGAPGVAAGSSINHTTGLVTLVYSGTYAILTTGSILSTYNSRYISVITDTGREELEDTYLVKDSSVGTTSASFKIVNYLGNTVTTSVDVLGYDPNIKTITLQTSPAGINVAGTPYVPAPGEKYQITGESKRYVTYDQGYTDTNKFVVAARSGEIQSPNEKVKVSFGIDLPPALFLENQAEAFRLFEIRPVITYSVESEL